ncbi:hypothetical protein KSP39_PZI024016 [Platanthera zijinensis]|uniref:MADS-box domain-containing protein n=1 Tax=Platanthera zijinensis TaxID=2320716 RepID=A0AAP0ATQ2_9ASPA
MARRKNASRPRSTANPNPNPRHIVNLENDLFREASNLSAATGASVALISCRPSGEMRVWGHPSPRSVINRYQRYHGRRFLEEAPPSVSEMVLAAEERARPYVEFRRRQEEMNGTSVSSHRTPEEQSAVEKEWIIEFLGWEIDRVQKRIEELVAAGGEAESPSHGSA